VQQPTLTVMAPPQKQFDSPDLDHSVWERHQTFFYLQGSYYMFCIDLWIVIIIIIIIITIKEETISTNYLIYIFEVPGIDPVYSD
jgi:uncharacterized integral membrane protein